MRWSLSVEAWMNFRVQCSTFDEIYSWKLAVYVIEASCRALIQKNASPNSTLKSFILPTMLLFSSVAFFGQGEWRQQVADFIALYYLWWFHNVLASVFSLLSTLEVDESAQIRVEEEKFPLLRCCSVFRGAVAYYFLSQVMGRDDDLDKLVINRPFVLCNFAVEKFTNWIFFVFALQM